MSNICNNQFTEKDIGILQKAISLYPNLEFACLTAKIAGQHLQFPLVDHESMSKLFELSSIPEKVKKRRITKDIFKKYFPDAFFPIESLEDLIGKILAAISYGESVHYHERLIDQPKKHPNSPCYIQDLNNNTNAK